MSRTRAQHRPTALHRAKATAVLASLRRRRERPESLVRTGDGTDPMHPLDLADPAAERALEAARRLISACQSPNSA